MSFFPNSFSADPEQATLVQPENNIILGQIESRQSEWKHRSSLIAM